MVLVVEGEMTIVLVIEETRLDLGAQVIGGRRYACTSPCGWHARRPSMPRSWMVNIRGGNSYPVSDIQTAREFHAGIPFLLLRRRQQLGAKNGSTPIRVSPDNTKDLADLLLQLSGAARLSF